jgi:hypothetical protein
MGKRLGTAGQRERGRGVGGKERRQQLGPIAQREREGGVRALGLAPIGGARLSGTEGAQARARACGLGLVGWFGPKWLFLFFLEFLVSFLFIFSKVFNSNSNQVSNSNQIKYVQQFKEYLGSI